MLELARVLAGPWAGQLLADLGADVIKIERPEEGDDTRKWGPPFVHDPDGGNLGAAYYHSCNRGKRSVAIDLSDQAGQRRVKDLAAEADVLIENYKVGGLARFGLDAASLRTLNRRLIYCSITGFGQTGPYASRAGYDFVIQGMAGVMSLTGEPDGAPQKAGIPVADLFTGMYSTVAILAALQRRQSTGQGTHIDMALLDSMVGALSNQALNWMVGGTAPKRVGNGHTNLAPYQSFSCLDGDVIVAVGNDRQFMRLCTVLGRPALGLDPLFATPQARLLNRESLTTTFQDAIRSWRCSDFASALEENGIPAGPVNAIDQVFRDPQVVARGLQVEVREQKGTVPSLASPIVFDGVRAVAGAASPRLDEHHDAHWLAR